MQVLTIRAALSVCGAPCQDYGMSVCNANNGTLVGRLDHTLWPQQLPGRHADRYEAWYSEANVVKDLPRLPAWASDNRTCFVQFDMTGGYGEMTVEGTSIECQDIGEEGQPRVFNRVKYCPTLCAQNPTMEGCQDCKQRAGGDF